MGGEKTSSRVCVYSFVSVFVCWTLAHWLAAAAAAGRQASKQSLKEERKEALLACLLVRQLLSTGKLVTLWQQQ